MKLPLIGITPCIDRGQRLRPGRDYLYVARAYSAAVAEAGGTPLLLTPDTPLSVVESLHGLVISGGDDLPRSFANSSNLPSEDTLGAAEDAERIGWERRLLDAALERGLPLLGICYGMQLLNLHLGGTLMRDLRKEHPGASDHGGSGVVTEHAARVESSAWLAALPADLVLNSSHGQAVDQLAPDLTATVWAEDGILEAFEGSNLCGVEWHPETHAETRLAVFSGLIERATAYGAAKS